MPTSNALDFVAGQVGQVGREGQRLEDVPGEALPMRALHSPSACVQDMKNAPQPQLATEGHSHAPAVEIVKPEWPRCSARKRLKRFSPVHTSHPH